MWRCKRCKNDISDNLSFCPDCGSPRPQVGKKEKKALSLPEMLLLSLVLVLGAALAFFILRSTGGGGLRIVSQPEARSVSAGAEVSFSVKVRGDEPAYRWQFREPSGDWENIDSPEAHMREISLTAYSIHNGCQYRCLVSDGEESLYSEAAVLTVKPKIAVTTQPKSVTADPGETVSLSAAANGEGLSYRWQFKQADGKHWNDLGASSAGSDVLTVKASAENNGCSYRCLISGSADRIYTDTATLVVRTAPVITSQPASVTVSGGSSVSFRVGAVGSDLSYRWQSLMPGSARWVDSTEKGANTASLNITAGDGIDGCKYRCIVSNGAGSVNSDEAKLLVRSQPVITAEPSSKTANEDSTVTFSLKATGGGLKYQWQYKKPGEDKWLNSNSTGAKTDSLEVKASASFDGCEYRCVVKNEAGELSSQSATLTLVLKPYIISNPSSVNVNEGTAVTLSVKAGGTDISYQWQVCKPGSDKWVSSNVTGAATDTIKLSARSALEGYKYRCAVSNRLGTVYSHSASITVRTKPVIISNPSSVTVEENSSVNFRVKAEGSGLSYRWEALRPGTSDWVKSGAAGSDTNTLQLTATPEIDGYKYRCAVSNDLGTVYSYSASITVRSKPVIVTAPNSVTVNEGKAVSFSVEATGGGLSYQWQMQQPGSAFWTDSKVNSAKTAALKLNASASLDGCKFRCAVTNSAGTTYSRVVTLTVRSKPEITSHPASATVNQDNTAVFRVRAEGLGLSYQWQTQKPGASTWVNSGGYGANTDTLKITADPALNGYKYRCVVKNSSGSVNSYSAKLTVRLKPVINSNPGSVYVERGSSVSFSVSASGSGLSYQWQALKPGTNNWVNSGGRGATTPYLIVTADAAMNGFQYRCAVSNSSGTTYSNAAYLSLR